MCCVSVWMAEYCILILEYWCAARLDITEILLKVCEHHNSQGPSWSWSYGSWIYSYLCNYCLSPLTFWVRIPHRRGVLDTTLYDKVCQWIAAGRWFSSGKPVSSINNQQTVPHVIIEILLKVALTIPSIPSWLFNIDERIIIFILYQYYYSDRYWNITSFLIDEIVTVTLNTITSSFIISQEMQPYFRNKSVRVHYRHP